MKTDKIPLLKSALEWAEREHGMAEKGLRPSNWAQESVYIPRAERIKEDPSLAMEECGSSYCIAGWVVSHYYGIENPYNVPPALRTAGLCGVMSEAQYLLGLTQMEADRLFDGDNSIDTIRTLVSDLVSEVPCG